MGRSPRSLSLGILLLVACSEETPVLFDEDTGVRDAAVDDVPAAAEAAVDAGRLDVPVDPADVVAADGGRVCRTVDDCTGADLCSNAQACRFGRCVVVGGPASCDDAVSCTDDSCDAAAGRCVHVANDMRCPADNFCAQESGCVRELPCEIGDTTCARLNGNPCTGTWSCEAARLRCVRSAAYNCDDMDTCTTDTCTVSGTAPMCAHRGPDYQTDVANCGACGTRCTAGPNQSAACTAGGCVFTCAAGYTDADRMPANGCECNSSAGDAPDLMFQDTNCDGIDGDASVAVFVSPRGDDANPGTRAMPKRTLPAAIMAAGAGTPTRPVYAAAGLYAGSVQLRSGVNVYGGYDDTAGWSRARSNATVIQGDTTAVLAQDLTVATELQLVTVQSAAATVPGASSYGVKALNSLLTLRGCTITSGNGAGGTSGADGADGADGSGGSNGGTPTGGAGGASSCGAPGGRGGDSRSGVGNGGPGLLGTTAPGGAAAGTGGANATRSGTCESCIGQCSGRAAASPPTAGAATAGASGRTGSNGGSAPVTGSVGGTGSYTPAQGVSGSAGAAGGGGGGGGAGTGGESGLPWDCDDGTGGGGGGGGGGGCGGAGGQGGAGGGGSFALMSVSSTIRIDDCQMNAGRGGRGGDGGDGGDGGNGGNAGSGGPTSGAGGTGGAGAPGGAGGDAGSGSGGPGGPSVCVYYLGAPPMVNALTCVRGGGGTGGGGGRNGAVGDAPDGATGQSEDVRAGM